jgi:hypothetical protein
MAGANSTGEREAALAEIAERDAAQGTVEDGAPEVATTSDPAESGSDAAAERVVKEGQATFEDQGREDVAASITRRRVAQLRGEDDDAGDGGDDGGDEPAAAAPAVTPARPATAKRVNVADLDADAVVVMKINGRDVEVALGDLVGNGQKYLAGEDYLNQAKDFLARTKGAATEQGAPPADRQNQPARQAAEQPVNPAAKTKVDRAKLADVVDRIQTGTPEEAADALAEILGTNADDAQNRGGVREAVRGEVAAMTTERAIQAEINEAIESLRVAHPALEKMPSIVPGLMQHGLATMVENLRAIGVPEEDLRLPATDIVKGYGTLRQNPQWRDKLAPIADVYGDAASKIEQELGIPAGKPSGTRPAGTQPVVRTREVNKTTIPVQPRSTGIRAEGAAPVTRTRDNSAVIAAMQEQREQGIPLRR